jgi:hypothetical protein
MAAPGDERRKKLLIKQRHVLEKELIALDKECRDLVSAFNDYTCDSELVD